MAMNICLDLPQMEVAEYARRQQVSVDSVKQLMDAGVLPFVQRKRGCKRMVNMVALAAQAAAVMQKPEPWNQPQEIARIDDF